MKVSTLNPTPPTPKKSLKPWTRRGLRSVKATSLRCLPCGGEPAARLAGAPHRSRFPTPKPSRHRVPWTQEATCCSGEGRVGERPAPPPPCPNHVWLSSSWGPSFLGLALEEEEQELEALILERNNLMIACNEFKASTIVLPRLHFIAS